MKKKVDVIVSFVLVLAAVVIAGANVYRVIPGRLALGGLSTEDDPAVSYVRDWEDLMAHGVLLGDESAPVKIIEFSDLGCPYCRQFHLELEDLKETWEDSFAVVFLHYPIDPKGEQAAVAVECAGAQGRFEPFLDHAFRHQDEIGTTPWAGFARAVDVGDLDAYSSCIAGRRTFPRIEKGKELASELEVHGTPTVIINGWRFARPPHSDLPEVVSRILAGERPY